MKRMHMPLVDARYWLGITLASIFGTNLGDLYAHELHLGIVLGLAILAVLAALVFLAERRDGRPNELFYWLVIIIIRTGATNIADYLAHHHIPRPPLALGFGLLVGLFGWFAARSDTKPPTDTVDLPPTGPAYWTAMLGAGVFGTLVGDICSHGVGQGPASLGLDALLALALLLWARSRARSFALYWGTIAVARSAGTSMGDWFAENKSLDIGLPLSTLMTGTVFVAVLLFWRSRASTAPAPD